MKVRRDRDFSAHYRVLSPRYARCPRRRKQSTGLFSSAKRVLLPPCSNPYIIRLKTKPTRLGGFCFWQRDRDSNPNKQSQSLSCYRYTIPLGTSDIILSVFAVVKIKIQKNEKIFIFVFLNDLRDFCTRSMLLYTHI